MLHFSKYFNGRGLNLTKENLLKYPCVNSYKVPVIPKYNFVALDFDNLAHQESDLFNLSRGLLDNGVLLIRQKITHEECYNEVLYHVDLLHSAGSDLIQFENGEDYNYFVFKKKKKMNSLFLGAYSDSKDKIQNALVEIGNSKLIQDNFIILHLFGENELWLNKDFTSTIPKFTINCIFTKHKEEGFENNQNAYNWNRLLNVCKAKKLLLINDNFSIKDFCSDKKYSKNYIYITDVKKARQIGGIDFKYETLDWAVYDFAVRMGDTSYVPTYNKNDEVRFFSKKSKGLLDNSIRWINVHEALGDNICAFNLLESLKRDTKLVVSTAYPFLYELSKDLKIRDSMFELNGLGFSVYEHGSELKSRSLESAYFSMNGEEELFNNRRIKQFYNIDEVAKIKAAYANKKLVLLAPSASNREGPSNGLMLSNKTWNFKNWEQIVSYLQGKGYYVIQVGVKEDFKVENVNEYFFNRKFSELAALIVVSKFFMGVDTFFQHLCGLMGKKGIVVTPAHNDHAFWTSTVYVVGKVKEDFEHLKWIKDHLNPFRAACMKGISVEMVKAEVDKILDCFNKY